MDKLEQLRLNLGAARAAGEMQRMLLPPGIRGMECERLLNNMLSSIRAAEDILCGRQVMPLTPPSTHHTEPVSP